MGTSTKDAALWDDRSVPTSESPDSPTKALTALLRELGLPESAIARAAEREHPDEPALDTLMAHQREERTASASDIEAAGGLPVEERRRSSRHSGFVNRTPPRPRSPTRRSMPSFSWRSCGGSGRRS